MLRRMRHRLAKTRHILVKLRLKYKERGDTKQEATDTGAHPTLKLGPQRRRAEIQERALTRPARFCRVMGSQNNNSTTAYAKTRRGRKSEPRQGR